MQFLQKTIPWLFRINLLLLATPFGGFASNSTKQQPSVAPKQPTNALKGSYNSPARIDVTDGWNVYSTFDFTYWQASQDNMEWAYVDQSPNTTAIANGTVQKLPFDFEPGFQLGFGASVRHDDWNLFAQYTWFRGKSNDSQAVAATGSTENLQPLWADEQNFFIATSYTQGSAAWKCHLDILDTQLSRPFYEGKSLTVTPFFGLRGTWLRQSFLAKYLTKSNPDVLTISQKANSWAIGPRIGLDSHWILGKGVRFFGTAGGDVSYTQYTSLGRHSDRIVRGTVQRKVSMKESDLGTLRAHLDLNLGLGWGSYFQNNRWHLDFSAGYTFQTFFDQNMFVKNSVRQSTSTSDNSIPIPISGNLYLQGLNLSVRADF